MTPASQAQSPKTFSAFSMKCYFTMFDASFTAKRIFPGAQMVKNLPAMQETWVQFLGGEDPLEKGMTTYSSIPAWRIPWAEKPDGYRQWSRNKHDKPEHTLS